MINRRRFFASSCYTRLYCKIYNFAIPAMNCRWLALPPRAAVHTVLAKSDGFAAAF